MNQIETYRLNESKTLIFPGSDQQTIQYATEDIIRKGQEAIRLRGRFTIALSGGSTPKKIYQLLKSDKYKDQLDYAKVYIFFGDERSVDPQDPESNYKMALENGFNDLPVPKEHIFRMKAESDIENGALEYEKILNQFVPDKRLDFVMLGMGDDGHTASLFPRTKALDEVSRIVVANQVPQKNTYRMTMTFPCINNAKHICLYVLGSTKKDQLADVLFSDKDYPSKHIGSKKSPAHWIIDNAAKEKIYPLLDNKKKAI